MNFAKFLRTDFLIGHLRWLLPFLATWHTFRTHAENTIQAKSRQNIQSNKAVHFLQWTTLLKTDFCKCIFLGISQTSFQNSFFLTNFSRTRVWLPLFYWISWLVGSAKIEWFQRFTGTHFRRRQAYYGQLVFRKSVNKMVFKVRK